MAVVRRLWPALLAGLVAAGVSLGVSELVSGLLKVRSAVIAVGDGAIDLVPPPVKDFAIATFGTNDKLALLVGIFAFIVIFAAIVGIIARYNLVLGAITLSLFGIVGAVAGIASPDPLPQAALPSLIGVAFGVVALVLLVRRLPAPAGKEHASSESASEEPESKGLDRRNFLSMSAKLTGVAVVVGAGGRWLTSQLSAAASRAAVALPAPIRQLAPIPPGADLGINGVPPFVTPNSTFYRIDTALIVPQVQTDDWTLKVSGMVDQPFELTFDELLERPMVERDITMVCVSNVVGGDLIGNARWLGVPLSDLLDEAGVDPQKATQVVGRSVDGFFSGFPTVAAYDGRSALVAVGMNGEPLPLDHGFPARLVVAGLYGYVSATKWLSEIELTTLEGFDSYWVRRNWAKEGPIKTQSRIDVPRGFAQLPPGPTAIAGVAWAPTRGINKVEVQIDEGPWVEARLGAPVNESTWRQWVHEWDATPGRHKLTVRATDGRGDTQIPVRTDPIPSGATGWHSVIVSVAP